MPPNNWRGSANGTRTPPALVHHRSEVKPARADGEVVTPESSVARPGDTDIHAHTNVELFVPAGGPANVAPQPRMPWDPKSCLHLRGSLSEYIGFA